MKLFTSRNKQTIGTHSIIYSYIPAITPGLFMRRKPSSFETTVRRPAYIRASFVTGPFLIKKLKLV